MFTSHKSIGVSQNPLTESVFNERFDETLISPGEPEFIITEAGLNLITEDNKFLETEG